MEWKTSETKRKKEEKGREVEVRRMTNGNEKRDPHMITRLTTQMTEEIAGRRCDSETKRTEEIRTKSPIGDAILKR